MQDDKDRLLLIEMTTNRKTIREACITLGLEKSAVHARIMRLIDNGYMTGKKSASGRYLSRTFTMTENGKKFSRQ